MHQMYVLYLPWDNFKRKTYKYALTVVHVASRYKEAEPLTYASTEFKGEFKNYSKINV